MSDKDIVERLREAVRYCTPVSPKLLLEVIHEIEQLRSLVEAMRDGR